MRRPITGMTIIEVMIAILIMSILLLMSIPSLTTYYRNSVLRNAVDDLQAGLEQAKFEAIKLNNVVNFTLNGNSWSISEPNPNGGSPIIVTSKTAAQNEANLAIAISPANTAITFNGQGYTTAASNLVLAITNPTAGTCVSAGGNIRCLSVKISTFGSIKTCDPALPSTDPRSCI